MFKRSKPRRRIPLIPNTLKLLALILIIFGFVVIFRHGYVPASYSPFATVRLDQPRGWFIDWRLAQLADDKPVCRRILQKPHITARPVSDRGERSGCGWFNAFRVSRAGGASVAPAMTMECALAAGLSLWVEHAVQPAAQKHFGSKVTSVRNVGGYNCRNIRGGIGKIFALRSEHARANAIDIVSFRLANGQTVSVLRDWPKKKSPRGKFLREVHRKACGYFRVTLGPEANKWHRDHFHLDRGPLRSCR